MRAKEVIKFALNFIKTGRFVVDEITAITRGSMVEIEKVLKKLKEWKEKKLITEEDFLEKKKELLLKI